MRVAASVVFHLLEGGEHDLAVGGEVGVVLGHVLVQLGAVEAAVEDDLRNRRADGPDAARPVEEVRQRGALESAAGGDGHLREERAVADADGGVGFGERALGGGNVGTALDKLRRHAGGNGGRRVDHGLYRNGKIGGNFAEQHGDGVLILRAQQAHVDRLPPARLRSVVLASATEM